MAKFKVGDWVSVVETNTVTMKARILEVITQKCEAGITQNSYLCRMYTKRMSQWSPHTIELRLREMELEKRKK